MKKFSLALFVLLCLAIPASVPCHAATAWEEAKAIPIQHNGRIKPLDAFARQTLKLISERESFKAKQATVFLLEQLADRNKIKSLKFIRVDLFELKKFLGLPEKENFFSLAELEGGFDKIQSQAREAKTKREKDLRPSKLEQKAEQLYTKIKTAQDLASGDSLRVLPAPFSSDWGSPYTVRTGFSSAFDSLIEKFKEKDALGFKKEVRAWTQKVYASLREAEGDKAVSSVELQNKILLEVLYYRVKPFETAAALYFLAFFLLSFFSRNTKSRITGFILAFLAILFHSFGLGLRVYILSRPPVSNMYESMIFMNWALVLFALIFTATRKKATPLTAACAISGFVMLYGNLLPIDSSLDVVVAVLKSNYWLTIHVLTIVSSYGAFGLALALGHRHLFLASMKKLDKKSEEESAQLIFKVMQLGTLLIGTGTFLGGVWANESWGRFWGWDPKETWALITFLGYLVVVHLKYAKKISNFYLALSSVVGFLLVLMTWYGVNFVLGRGLHSYGAGSGGMIWVIYYLGIEMLFLAWVFLRSK